MARLTLGKNTKVKPVKSHKGNELTACFQPANQKAAQFTMYAALILLWLPTANIAEFWRSDWRGENKLSVHTLCLTTYWPMTMVDLNDLMWIYQSNRGILYKTPFTLTSRHKSTIFRQTSICTLEKAEFCIKYLYLNFVVDKFMSLCHSFG